MAKQSERSHWEKFWTQKKDPSQIYDNSGRIPAAVFEVLGDVAGKKVLEVGAGTGRDS
ncbi:MAG TPA: class I SAM-dependent methyltransferase, partial [candidate division Zixibacteria bacterium]|nr:class I SAM-dependent methyltransferase [candidate division Zixibacteria bacterium]